MSTARPPVAEEPCFMLPVNRFVDTFVGVLKCCDPLWHKPFAALLVVLYPRGSALAQAIRCAHGRVLCNQ